MCVCSVSASVARESVDRELQTYTKYNRECDVTTDVRVGPVLSFRSHPDRSLFSAFRPYRHHPGRRCGAGIMASQHVGGSSSTVELLEELIRMEEQDAVGARPRKGHHRRQQHDEPNDA